jgi:hypothetical protein
MFADADAAALLHRAWRILDAAPATTDRLERELTVLTRAARTAWGAAEGYASPRFAGRSGPGVHGRRRLGVEPAAPAAARAGDGRAGPRRVRRRRRVRHRLRALGDTDDVLAVEGDFVRGVAAGLA